MANTSNLTPAQRQLRDQDQRWWQTTTTGAVSGAALGAVAACAWNSWIHQLVPPARLGVFFARRQFMATALSMVVGLAAGWYLKGKHGHRFKF